jgi:hypothetical protein
MIGNYALYRKGNDKPILIGDISELDAFVKELCALNPIECKKRDYEIKVINANNAPNEMPCIVGNRRIAMTVRKRRNKND